MSKMSRRSKRKSLHPVTSEERISLDVGGKVYTTSLTTMLKYPESRLGHMFGRDGGGSFTIDRNGELFGHILNFLRDDELTLPENFAEVAQLKKEVDHYEIEPMLKALEEFEAARDQARDLREPAEEGSLVTRSGSHTGGSHRPRANDQLAKIEPRDADVDDHKVLQDKLRRQQDLKRKLKSDINVTLKTISESDAYVKTSATLKTAGQKTGEVLTVAGQKTGEVLGKFGNTWGSLMRNSKSAQDVNVAAGAGAEVVENGKELIKE